MLEIRNRTPFPAALLPGLDKEGVGYATLIVKGTFRMRGGPGAALADEQRPIELADKYTGEPGLSSLVCEAEGVLRKNGTDILLTGSARARSGRVKVLDVSLEVSTGLKKTVRVFGDRQWRTSFGVNRATDPVPFEEMPLVYERAFGGNDASHPDPARHEYEKRNPVGKGFVAAQTRADIDATPLPNLEDPRKPLSAPKDRPGPACFGPVAPSWAPRVGYAGTYDEAWTSSRCPLLPADFDERFFNAAPADQVSAAPLRGGEQVRVTGMSRSGDLVFAVPRGPLRIDIQIKGKETNHPALLDTLRIDPDEERISLTWRAAIPCGQDFLYVDWIRVREAA